MTEAVLSVDAAAPAGEVLRRFADCPIQHLPVVDQGSVVDVLGSTDLMRLELPVHHGCRRVAGRLRESLRQIAERHVTAGRDEHRHAVLVRAVAAAGPVARYGRSDRPAFGLES